MLTFHRIITMSSSSDIV